MSIPLSLILVHFLVDFLLQTDWMALNKSKDNYALSCHVATYSVGLFVWATIYMGIGDGAVMFFFFNSLLHFMTDWVTSRINGKLWFFRPYDDQCWIYVDGRRHWFFVMVGFDQLIHYVTLAITLRLLS
jgi:hypothetical protein